MGPAFSRLDFRSQYASLRAQPFAFIYSTGGDSDRRHILCPMLISRLKHDMA